MSDVRPGLIGDVGGETAPPAIQNWISRLPRDLCQILNSIAEHNGGAWLVGGAPRDAMLGEEIGDIDLAVSLSPNQMLEIFPDAIPTGIQFGTLTLRGERQNYEATTLRTEAGYGDGRRPDEVEWGDSLAVDLQRRDFTMNAIAVDAARGLVHDPHNGLSDLERGILRSVGSAKSRLSEDGLRIMRAYRFMDRGQGVWYPNHELASALSSSSRMLDKVAMERIWSEFKRILSGKNAHLVLARMIEDGNLAKVIPAQWSISSPTLRIIEENHEWHFLDKLAVLLAESKISECRIWLSKLKLSKADRDYVLRSIEEMGHLPGEDKSSLRIHRQVLKDRALRHLEIEYFIRLYKVRLFRKEVDSATPEEVKELISKAKSLPQLQAGPDSILSGTDIMAATGLGKSRELGCLKNWLHRIQVERDISSKQEMMKELAKLYWRDTDCNQWPRIQFPL